LRNGSHKAKKKIPRGGKKEATQGGKQSGLLRIESRHWKGCRGKTLLKEKRADEGSTNLKGC